MWGVRRGVIGVTPWGSDRPILVVGEEREKIEALVAALQGAYVSHPIQVARTARQAISYLAGEAPYAERGRWPVPALLVVHLGAPRSAAFQVLRWIHEHPWLRGLPALVIVDSPEPRTLRRAYELGANSCLLWPAEPQALPGLLRRALRYWLRLNLAPGGPEPR